MANSRAHVIISGRVQGVFYRAHTRETARSLNLKGWVKNRYDSTVEAIFEGDEKDIEKMVEWCRQGPPSAKVDDVNVEWKKFTGEFNSFDVVH